MKRIPRAQKNLHLKRALATCEELRNASVMESPDWLAGFAHADLERELDAMLELRAVLQALARKLNMPALAEAKST
jgi:hypothetical protein